MINQANIEPHKYSKESAEKARENGRKGGKRSGEVKREAKTFARALSMILDEQVSDDSKLTKRQAICVKLIRKIFDNPDIRDVKVLTEILGEYKQTIQAAGTVLNIQTSEEGAKGIKEMIEQIENDD